MLELCSEAIVPGHANAGLSVWPPATAEDAVTAAMTRLATCEPQLTERVGGAWDGVLNQVNGVAPVIDLGISSLRRELRWSARIPSPDADPRASLARALGLARRLGVDVPAQAAYDLQRLSALQHGVRDGYAVWLSGRHRAPRKDGYSVCVELPPQFASSVWTVLGRRGTRARQLLGGLGTPRFLRFNLDRSDGLEVFCQTHSSFADVPELVTDRAGFSRVKTKNPLRAAMNSWAAQSPDELRTLGVSVAINRFAEPSAIAVFTSAAELFDTNTAARDDILARAADQRWLSRGIYDALTAGEALSTGAVSFIASRVGRVEQRISLVSATSVSASVSASPSAVGADPNPLCAFAG